MLKPCSFLSEPNDAGVFLLHVFVIALLLKARVNISRFPKEFEHVQPCEKSKSAAYWKFEAPALRST